MRAGKLVFLLALILCTSLPLPAQKLSVLEKEPDWSQLDRFQETISRKDFVRLLDTVYAPRGAWKETISVGPHSAIIRQSLSPEKNFILRFGDSQAVPRYWRAADEISLADSSPPLTGVRIALDPGHLGGQWARMEERWFQIGNVPPVTEGDMTLLVARKLAAKLKAEGATVELVRDGSRPVTDDRPKDLEEAATQDLADRGVIETTLDYDGAADRRRFASIRWLSELLFYRASEIRARACLVNQKLQPDLTVCLHFNAEAWGDPAAPALTDKQHMHFLINGCYSAKELEYDDVRFGMLEQLLSRTARPSLDASEAVARSMKAATGLPPYEYTGPNAFPVGTSGYVWARNLLANRLYHCPVIYAEPYVMNSLADFTRIEMGDYEGQREVAGELRSSIFEEYAEGMHQGILEYFHRGIGIPANEPSSN